MQISRGQHTIYTAEICEPYVGYFGEQLKKSLTYTFSSQSFHTYLRVNLWGNLLPGKKPTVVSVRVGNKTTRCLTTISLQSPHEDQLQADIAYIEKYFSDLQQSNLIQAI